MSATGLRPEASWTAKWSVSLVSLAALCLIFVFLVYTGKLFGSNYDVPPTWYWVLTVLLIAVDAIAMFYVTFKIVQVVLGVNVPSHLLRITVVILLALVAAHGTAVCSYSMIPQWDFQDSLFDDLSWRRGSGRISADCREAVNQSTSLKGNVSASAALYADRPSSYDEIQRIAQDWQRSDSDLENRTAAGWRGWIRDVSRHGHYSNPKHRLVTLFLQDPYSGGDATMFGQRPEAVLSYFDSTEVSKLTVGQEVVVCGRISDATLNADGGIRISISEPVVNPLPLPEALNTTEIPSDLLIEYEAHGCGEGYECPEYDVRIDSQGNVTYRGFENVPITGCSDPPKLER